MSNTIVFIFSLVLTSMVSLLAIVGLRRRFFSEGYAGLWFLTSLGMFAIVFFPEEVKNLSVTLGFQNNTSFLFLLGIILLIMVSMVQSIHISKLRRQIKDLAQSVAQSTQIK